MNDAIVKEVQEVFRTFFSNQSIQLKAETTVRDIDHWDSLTHLELLHSIEQQFKIQFSFEEILSFANVGEMIKCIEGKIN